MRDFRVQVLGKPLLQVQVTTLSWCGSDELFLSPGFFTGMRKRL
jgi:hypothetical protein